MTTGWTRTAYTGDMHNGMRHGYGVYAGDDYQYVGLWANDAPHGTGTRQLANGLMEHGEFECGILAIGHRAWPSGDFEDGRFIDGELAAGRRQRGTNYEEGEFIQHPLLT